MGARSKTPRDTSAFPAGVIPAAHIDAAGRITFWNQAMEQLTGRPAACLGTRAVATAAPGTSGRPQTRVIAATFPCSPRHVPTTSSQRSIVQSGFAAAVSLVAAVWSLGQRLERT